MKDGAGIEIQVIGGGNEALAVFFEGLPDDSGWPAGTVLSLTDRAPTEFERAAKYIAAFDGDRIVGALSLHPEPAGNYHRLHNIHFHIDVLPDWQRRGIGGRLVSRLLEYAQAEGYWRIHMGTLSSNTGALALFAAFGFRVEGVSRAAYRVRTEDGGDYFVDGVGLALWLGPSFQVPKTGEWQRRLARRTSRKDGIFYRDNDLVLRDDLVALFRSVADHRHRYPAMLSEAWTRSDATVTARDGDRLVGLARGISDEGTTFFICDVLVHPDYQHRGIGSQLMKRIIRDRKGIYQIMLLTDPETMPFYQQLGYMHWNSAALKMSPPSGKDRT